MTMQQINYKKLDGNMPEIQSPKEGDAGIDLYTIHDLEFKPYEWLIVNTGVALEIPKGYCGLVLSRSGTRFKSMVFTSLGLIDSSYRGEIKLLLKNNSVDERYFKKYTRIAQLLIVPYLPVEMICVDELEKTKRNENGFGSTGN